MKKVLVAQQGDLIARQIEELGWDFSSIEYLEEVDNRLFSKCLSCPSNAKDLTIVARKLIALMENYDAVVLPIGSTAFMFILGAEMHFNGYINEVPAWGRGKRPVCMFSNEEIIEISCLKHTGFMDV
jgi:hypothetical protein